MQKQHTWLRTLHSEATAVVQTIHRYSKYIITLYLPANTRFYYTLLETFCEDDKPPFF
jgi:hypothetical protein